MIRVGIGTVVLVLGIAGSAAGQNAAGAPVEAAGRWSVSVAGGSTVNGGGYDASASIWFAPLEQLELGVNVERLHLPFDERVYDDGAIGWTRGGTMTFATGEIRGWFRPRDRVSPFLAIGGGAGISRPTVNRQFPNAVENDVKVLYVGGGVRVPVGRSIEIWGDARAMMALEGYDTVMGLWPVRAGVSWRF